MSIFRDEGYSRTAILSGTSNSLSRAAQSRVGHIPPPGQSSNTTSTITTTTTTTTTSTIIPTTTTTTAIITTNKQQQQTLTDAVNAALKMERSRDTQLKQMMLDLQEGQPGDSTKTAEPEDQLQGLQAENTQTLTQECLEDGKSTREERDETPASLEAACRSMSQDPQRDNHPAATDELRDQAKDITTEYDMEASTCNESTEDRDLLSGGKRLYAESVARLRSDIQQARQMHERTSPDLWMTRYKALELEYEKLQHRDRENSANMGMFLLRLDDIEVKLAGIVQNPAALEQLLGRASQAGDNDASSSTSEAHRLAPEDVGSALASMQRRLPLKLNRMSKIFGLDERGDAVDVSDDDANNLDNVNHSPLPKTPPPGPSLPKAGLLAPGSQGPLSTLPLFEGPKPTMAYATDEAGENQPQIMEQLASPPPPPPGEDPPKPETCNEKCARFEAQLDRALKQRDFLYAQVIHLADVENQAADLEVRMEQLEAEEASRQLIIDEYEEDLDNVTRDLIIARQAVARLEHERNSLRLQLDQAIEGGGDFQQGPAQTQTNTVGDFYDSEFARDGWFYATRTRRELEVLDGQVQLLMADNDNMTDEIERLQNALDEYKKKGGAQKQDDIPGDHGGDGESS
ncbi:hypothetical protein BP6252_09440 [Coleophoma cylindrospora]|uniref:Uncharacterized protein n=1 Tax=Coleophoma cylindrospora TaxID=1849047 RepID=A0A3D8R2K1_9HELO|nr:hypothetical protein BP6252_09440 [Coleophoma cylindrospora]